MKERSEVNLKNRFEKLEEVSVCNFRENMKEEATKLAGKTKKEPPALSTEDLEINN